MNYRLSLEMDCERCNGAGKRTIQFFDVEPGEDFHPSKAGVFSLLDGSGTDPRCDVHDQSYDITARFTSVTRPEPDTGYQEATPQITQFGNTR